MNKLKRLPKMDGDMDSLPMLNLFNSADELLMAKGVYYITGEIMEDSLLAHHQDLLMKHIDPQWNEEVILYINSPGGVTYEGWAFIDLLDFVRMDIRTVAMGLAASFGAMLLAAGTKGKRFASRNASLMIHQYSGGIYGESHNSLMAKTKDLKLEQDRHIRFWKEHSKFETDEEVLKHLLTGVDAYITPEEALDFGIIDGILEPSKKLSIVPVSKKVKPKTKGD